MQFDTDGHGARVLPPPQVCGSRRYAQPILFQSQSPEMVVECTSAVSSDVEGRMYEHAKSIGITLITISLRYASVSFPAYDH